MKKLFLLLLILPLAFVACSDDDESDADKIVGTWSFSKEVYVSQTKNDTDNVLLNAMNKYYESWEQEEPGSFQMTLNADGIYKETSTFPGSEDELGKYTLKGNVLTIEFEDEDGERNEEVYIYSFDAGQLVIGIDNTEDAEYDYGRKVFDEFVEEGKTIAEGAAIVKVINNRYLTKK